MYVRCIFACVCPLYMCIPNVCLYVYACPLCVCLSVSACACVVNVKSHRSFPDFKTDILVPDARGFSCELPL